MNNIFYDTNYTLLPVRLRTDVLFYGRHGTIFETITIARSLSQAKLVDKIKDNIGFFRDIFTSSSHTGNHKVMHMMTKPVSNRTMEYSGVIRKTLQQNILTLDVFFPDLTKPEQNKTGNQQIAMEKKRGVSCQLHPAAGYVSGVFRSMNNPGIRNEEVAEMAIRVKPSGWKVVELKSGIAIHFYK